MKSLKYKTLAALLGIVCLGWLVGCGGSPVKHRFEIMEKYPQADIAVVRDDAFPAYVVRTASGELRLLRFTNMGKIWRDDILFD